MATISGNRQRGGRGNAHEYRECGLSNVWLANGFKLKGDGPSQVVEVTDPHGLSKAIEVAVTRKFERLDPNEFCFLNGSLGLSRRDLASMFGISERSVLAWEKRNGPPLWADRLLRAFHRERRGEVNRFWSLFDEESRMGKATRHSDGPKRRTFGWNSKDGWREMYLPLVRATTGQNEPEISIAESV